MFSWQKNFSSDFLIIILFKNKTKFQRVVHATKGLAIYCVGDFDFLIPKRE